MEPNIGEVIVGVAVFLVPIVGSIALFSFLGVTTWSDARRKEREAYYTSEAMKKIAESSGEGARLAVEYFRERERRQRGRWLEGLKLGGLITAAVGIGLMALLHGLNRQGSTYLVGLIPLLIGVALLVYVYILPPKE